MSKLLMLSALLLSITSAFVAAEEWSLVINNGRVIDPETGLDDIRHIGIKGSTITEISLTPLQGGRIIDASGLVVTPGFIDLHTHSPTQLGQYYQLFDGITTALELEMGAYPVAKYGDQISQQPLINYGASVGYLSLRTLEKQGIEYVHLTGQPKPVNALGWFSAFKTLFMDISSALKATFHENASKEELDGIRTNLNTGLAKGGLGIGLALDYISEAVNHKELSMVFQVAAEHKAPLFIHLRRGINGDPSGLYEALKLAKQYGTSLHICHITHNSMVNTRLFLDAVRDAQKQGVDITTEVLPYNAGSALISAAVFSRDWRTIFAIDYGDVERAATGERFTEETWFKVREEHPNAGVIHHYLKEEYTQMAVKEPGVIIVSDLLPMESKDKNVAPHNGAFSKILSQYVREQGLIDLPTAISKMTLLPAQRLESYAPIFKSKGRIKIGADADITIFDAQKIQSQASYQNPYQEALGFEYVIVNGQAAISKGELVKGVYPGRRLLSK